MKPDFPEATLEQIKADLRAGQKISAIKRLHVATGMQLMDAKNAVENLHAELHAKDPAAYPVPKSGTGCAVVLVLVLLVAGAVMLLFLLRR